MALVAKPMLFSSCRSAQNALPSVPCDEVYGISGPCVCGSDPLLPTEQFPEKVQEQNHRVNSAVPTCAFFFESRLALQQRIASVRHRINQRRGLTHPRLLWRM